MDPIVIIPLLIVAIPLTLFLVFKPIMADKKARSNVTNSDPLTQHYCFVLDCGETEAIEKLSVRNVNDTLEYTFDTNRSVIAFSHLGASIEHQLSFYVVEGKTYLKVSRVKLMHDRSNVPLMINRFFIEKIGAVPVDYSCFMSSV